MLEYVIKEGGINYNILVMRIGENLISNFYRQLKKELIVKSKIFDQESFSSENTGKEIVIDVRSNWEITPLELLEILQSSSIEKKREIKSDNKKKK